MGVFGIFGKGKPKTQHLVFRCKKNGKKYLIVADDLDEAETIVNTVYPGYGLTKADITEETNDIDLLRFYGNEKKNIYETNY